MTAPTPIPKQVDVLLISIIDAELRALFEALGLGTYAGPEGDCLGAVISKPAGQSVFVVCEQATGQGCQVAHGLAQRKIRAYKPKHILVVGTAGGIIGGDRDPLRLGDVVISSFLTYYELSKYIKGMELPRETVISPPSIALQEIATPIRHQEHWSAPLTVLRPDGTGRPKIIPGHILSGEKLHGDAEHPALQKLLELHPKALAVEMESGGVARAVYEAQDQQQVTYLVVRGVSDFCNGEKDNQATRDAWRKYAAGTAAAAAIAILQAMPARKPAETQDLADPEQLKRALDDAFPTPKAGFALTLAVGTQLGIAAKDVASSAWFLELMVKYRRLYLVAPAGAGKSHVVGALARSGLRAGFELLVLDLKGLGPSVYRTLSALPRADETGDVAMDHILNAALGDISVDRLVNAHPQYLLILVDGLNEIPHDRTEQVIETVLSFVRRHCRDAGVLVTDRLARESMQSKAGWVQITIEPLDEVEVARHVSDVFGPAEYDSLSRSARSLLTSPYFLDLAMQSTSAHLASRSQAISDFLTKVVGLTSPQCAALAGHVYQGYRDLAAPLVDLAKLRMEAPDCYDKLTKGGLIRGLTSDSGQLLHQLVHDYLAAEYCIQKDKEEWNYDLFDVVTLDSQSFDALSMALELVDNDRGDELLARIYDWNWLGTLETLAGCLRGGHRPFSDDIEWALLAVVGEKMFDPIEDSALRTREAVRTYPAALDPRIADMSDRSAITEWVRGRAAEKEWFERWRRFFLATDPLTVDEISHVCDHNSLIGWTVANALRRAPPSDAVILFLQGVLVSHPSRGSFDRSVRWRIVHALGAFDRESATSLLTAQLTDEYLWVRYGAMRSLLEIAARTTNAGLRSSIVNELKRDPGRVLPLVNAVSRVVRYRDPAPGWEEVADAVICAMRDAATEEKVKGAWSQVRLKMGAYYHPERDIIHG